MRSFLVNLLEFYFYVSLEANITIKNNRPTCKKIILFNFDDLTKFYEICNFKSIYLIILLNDIFV